MQFRPDPTFDPSRKLAMQAPPEKTGISLIRPFLSLYFYAGLWPLGVKSEPVLGGPSH